MSEQNCRTCVSGDKRGTPHGSGNYVLWGCKKRVPALFGVDRRILWDSTLPKSGCEGYEEKKGKMRSEINGWPIRQTSPLKEQLRQAHIETVCGHLSDLGLDGPSKPSQPQESQVLLDRLVEAVVTTPKIPHEELNDGDYDVWYSADIKAIRRKFESILKGQPKKE